MSQQYPGPLPDPVATRDGSAGQFAPPPRRPEVSRRSLLRRGAGIGAVGLAAAAVGAGGAVAATRKPATPDIKPAVKTPWPPPVMAGPLFLYVPDTTSGVVYIYGDTNEVQANSPALVSQVLRVIQ